MRPLVQYWLIASRLLLCCRWMSWTSGIFGDKECFGSRTSDFENVELSEPQDCVPMAKASYATLVVMTLWRLIWVLLF